MQKHSQTQTNQRFDYGLQALTPIYGQMIQAAPSWSGPFQAPPLPAAIPRPKQQSAASFWGGLGANLLTTAGCAAIGGEIGMLACPILGDAVGDFVSKQL